MKFEVLYFLELNATNLVFKFVNFMAKHAFFVSQLVKSIGVVVNSILFRAALFIIAVFEVEGLQYSY